MQIFNTPQRYGAIVQFLHWTTAVLVVLAWLLGTFDDVFPKGAARNASLFVHMSAGLAVLTVVAVRLLWRFVDVPLPPEVTRFGAWLDRAGRYAHWALYAILIAVPVTGILVQFARGQPVPLFGFGEIASPWAADRAFARLVKEPHEFLSNLLMLLAGVHAAAALAHHWLLRDRTLKRMLPGATG